MEKVSVIIPIYNVEDYLEDCLNSVVFQSLSMVEIICVNDGSTDKSGEILDRFAQIYDNIRVINQENQGLSCARNCGLKVARGEYVYFLDSDDMLGENVLSEMYEYSKTNNLDILYFDATTVYENTKMQNRFPYYQSAYSRSKSYGVFAQGQELMKEFVDNNEYYASVCLQLIRRKYLEDKSLSFYPHILHEDELFTFQSMFLAERVGHLAAPYFIRCIRNNSIMTSKRNFENFYGVYTAYKEMLAFLERDDIPETRDKDTVISIMENISNVACNIYTYSLNKEERKKCDIFGKAEHYQILLNIKNRISVYKKYEYPCPYYLFESDSQIALYGAGNIGRRYYFQISESKYGTIVNWVDKNYRKLQDELLPVNPVASLTETEFDYIFLAVADEIVADEIIIQLNEMGISNSRIIWCGAEYGPTYQRQMGRLNKRIDLYNQVWDSVEAKCFLFMTPEHGNMGDYAIALSERRIIKEYFPQLKLVEITMMEWTKYEDLYKSTIMEKDVLFISGGGYLGNMWKSGEVVKELITSFPNNIKIMFPNTLTYVDNNIDEMKKGAEFYRMQNNLYIFARERATYDRLQEFHYRDKEYLDLFPDMALGLDYSDNHLGERRGVMLCFRTDLEKICSDTLIEVIRESIKIRGQKLIESDINLKKTIKRKYGESELLKTIEQFQRIQLVITDRLHGMIFAAITATPCIAFNNSTGKVKEVYKWIEHLPYVIYMEEEDFTEEIIDKMEAINNCVYDNSFIMEQLHRMGHRLKEITNIIYERD
jgi:exopolysaccharide biosynthesis predicted pyruvyltransferase EpsI/glycosyltransferase involved in cell wall biosynthesis